MKFAIYVLIMLLCSIIQAQDNTKYHKFNNEDCAFEYKNLTNKFNTPLTWYHAPKGSYTASCIEGRVVAGDFNGDGFTDLASMYDYGNGVIGIHVWLSDGNGKFICNTWYQSSPGSYTANRVTGRMVAGDFNGDGKCDIAAMYDYGNSEARIHVWLSNGQKFEYATWHKATQGSYTASRITGRMVAGDFNGDGKCDIAAMYDYGNSEARIHVWLSNGQSFAIATWYQTAQGSYTADRVTGRIVAGDFNDDGFFDIAAMYEYWGDEPPRIHVWLSNGQSFVVNTWYQAPQGSYTASCVKILVTGKFNFDGKYDLASFYDYGNSEMGIHTFCSDPIGTVKKQIITCRGCQGKGYVRDKGFSLDFSKKTFSLWDKWVKCYDCGGTGKIKRQK